MLGQVKLKQEVASRLKQAREQAGYNSIEEFCKKNELSLKEYPRHESGKRALRASQAIRYCQLLNVRLYWLFIGKTEYNQRLQPYLN